jgi:hypothetical protein
MKPSPSIAILAQQGGRINELERFFGNVKAAALKQVVPRDTEDVDEQPANG